jgi:hypothetical protein
MRQCKWLAQTLPTCSRLRAFHPGKDANRRLESARIAAIRELLDRRYGRAGQTPEVIRPENDIIQTMLDTSTAVIGSLSVRKRFVGTEVRSTGDDYALRRPRFPPAAPVENVSERSDVGIESPALSPTRAYAAATPILSSGRRGMRPSTAGPQRAAGIVEALITEAG